MSIINDFKLLNIQYPAVKFKRNNPRSQRTAECSSGDSIEIEGIFNVLYDLVHLVIMFRPFQKSNKK